VRTLGFTSLILGLVLAAYSLSKQDKHQDKVTQLVIPASAVTQVPTKPKAPSAPVAQPIPQAAGQDLSEFRKRFARESEAVGQLDDTPEATEAHLRSWAQSLAVAELRDLQQKALNAEASGDERFLAVQMLGWSGKAEALPLLEEVALAPVPNSPESRTQSAEVALRALAIESAGQVGSVEQRLSSLNRVANQVSNSFLSDRSQRAMAHLTHPEIAEPATQDQQALTKLLNKNH